MDVPQDYTLLLPMKVDAFVFNGPVCDGEGPGKAKVAPITQPNYTFLQLGDRLAQHDILPHVDLHAAAPRALNARFSDIGKDKPRTNRAGVYVHWTMPRPLRSGVAVTKDDTKKDDTKKDDKKKDKGGGDEKPVDGEAPNDPSVPRYPALPNRWLVIRSLHQSPAMAATGAPAVTAWVIESDRTRSVDELDITADVEVDVSPFVTSFLAPKQKPGDISVEEQAEVFIGHSVPAADWDPKDQPGDEAKRVGLSAASSSNQLFVDCQYHCSNVFSMLDTFEYVDQDNNTQHLEKAEADYYVVGWHNNPDKDLLKPAKGDEEEKRSARLEALRIAVDRTVPKEAADAMAKWLDAPGAGRTLFHGAMYDVEWNIDALPGKRPADELAATMDKMPFAVGTTPMDAVLAYLGPRSAAGEVEKGIMALQALLKAADDGVDAQVAAEDEVQAYNFSHLDGGDHFYLPAGEGKAGQGAVGSTPSPEAQDDLRATNAVQHLLDGTRRRIKQLRWDIFSWWWKLISDVDAGQGSSPVAGKPNVYDTRDELEVLLSLACKLEALVEKNKPALPAKKGVMEAFHQRADPTLIIGGVEAGWPVDFNADTLAARLSGQTADKGAALPPTDAYVDCIGADVREAGRHLVQEFLALRDVKADPKKDDRLRPLYHDGRRPDKDADSKTNPWRDRWAGSQPWSPLYVEWEAEYAHIPYEHWELGQRDAGTKQSPAPKATYLLKDDIRHKDPTTAYPDLRYVAGRALLLPQPAFSLRVHIQRLFDTLPAAQLDGVLDGDSRRALLNKLDELALLSLPLSGLTDHLVTRYQGSHVKPMVRQPGHEPIVLQEATKVLPPPPDGGNNTKRRQIDLGLIGESSDPTPYGSLATLAGLPRGVSGFKPVTHGQLRFSKINVVDKFGQVVHAIDPALVDDPPAIYPTVGDVYAIDGVPGDGGDDANVVDPLRSSLHHSEYVQLLPAINQPARLNAHFVVPNADAASGGAKWRPATEFDEPVWGWVVVNYADRGLQFFLPNGAFYREVRSAGSTVEWLPFSGPPGPTGNVQLDALVSSLARDEDRLRAFMDMAMTALGATVPPPTAYSQFLNALVGRPLALANTGWSLELAGASLRTESSIHEQVEAELDTGLLPGDGRAQYEFAVKFGDKANNYDGLVAYFAAKDDKAPAGGGDLDLSKMYTYFHTKYKLDGKVLAPIDKNSYPKLKSYWRNPHDYVTKSPSDDLTTLARSYEGARNRELQVFGALLDPFAPISAYTGILPVRKLTLPGWTWTAALKRITAFFHAGPVLLTKNVPAFQAENRLGQDDGNALAKPTPPGHSVHLPALRTADWAWLQPYDLGSDSDPQAYMALDVTGGGVDEAPSWTPGPMTAVEGFMQLRAPIEQGKPAQ